jgi:hypothetical protein
MVDGLNELTVGWFSRLLCFLEKVMDSRDRVDCVRASWFLDPSTYTPSLDLDGSE